MREIAQLFANLPSNPSNEDWGRVTDALIEEAETRTAELRARIDDKWSGAKLCDIVESMNDVE